MHLKIIAMIEKQQKDRDRGKSRGNGTRRGNGSGRGSRMNGSWRGNGGEMNDSSRGIGRGRRSRGQGNYSIRGGWGSYNRSYDREFEDSKYNYCLVLYTTTTIITSYTCNSCNTGTSALPDMYA